MVQVENEIVSALIDGGGTYTRAYYFDAHGNDVLTHVYQSAEFPTLDDLLDQAFGDAGATPRRIAFALAGKYNRQDQTLTSTNRPEWGEFDIANFCQKRGIGEYAYYNDVELKAADAHLTPREQLRVVKPGKFGNPNKPGRWVVITLSTGLGPAIGENKAASATDDSLPVTTVATELGHYAAVPLTPKEREFCDYVAGRLGVTVPTTEQVVSGAWGFRFADEWLRSLGHKPSEATERRIAELRRQGKDIGPAITDGFGRDGFCDRIIFLIGGLFGTYVRQMMGCWLPELGVHLVGGVTDGALQAFIDGSPFMSRLEDPTMAHGDKAVGPDGVAVFHNTSPDLDIRGAQALLSR